MVALRVFFKDPADADTVRAILNRRFPTSASFSFVLVPRLATDAMRLEIEAESYRP